MAKLRFMSHIVKPLALTATALLLFMWGVAATLYSPWFQDRLRMALVEFMNRRPGTEFRLDSFRIDVPLRLRIDGLLWKQDGDTAAAAASFSGHVRPLPLFEGKIELGDALLTRGAYNMGSIDSATMIRIKGDTIRLHESSVTLKDMKINVSDGLLAGGSLDLWINPDPPRSAADTVPAKQSPLSVGLRHLKVRDLTYRMSLMPTIDSLGVHIADADLAGVGVDLLKQTVNVDSLTGHGLNAAYIAPDSAQIARTVVAPPSKTESEPWTVRVGLVQFDRSAGLYTTHGLKPADGFDPAYISATGMTLVCRDFYNRATDVTLPVELAGTERCGVRLRAAGTLTVTAEGLSFDKFNIGTVNGTDLKASGYLATGDLASDPDLKVRLGAEGSFAVSDAALMFPFVKAYTTPLPSSSGIFIGAAVDGTIGRLKINKLELGVPGVLDLRGSGVLTSVMMPARMGGDIRLSGHIGDVEPWITRFVPGAAFRIPVMDVNADIAFNNGNYKGSLSAVTHDGDISLDGTFGGRGPAYTADLSCRQFPVSAFLPTLGIGTVTGHVSADGNGLDISKATTVANVSLDIDNITYQGAAYSSIKGTARLSDGHAGVTLDSRNPGLDFALDAKADIAPDRYDVDGTFDARGIDLQKLKVSQTPATLRFSGGVDAAFNTAMTDIAATLRLDTLTYRHETGAFGAGDLTLHLNSADSVTNASIRNKDMFAYFSSPMLLMPFVDRLSAVAPFLSQMMASHHISVIELQKILPEFNLAIQGGSDNMVAHILGDSKISMESFGINAANDSLIHLDARILGFSNSAMRFDTLTLDVSQKGERLDIIGRINNRPGTFDQWAHVNFDGYFETDRLGITMRQRNIQGKTGFDVGANLTLGADSTATLTFDKLDPTIGYSPWTVNSGNYITYDFRRRHIDADLHMQGAGSKVSVFTEHAGSADSTLHTSDEDLVIDITDLRIQDWITINPFAPVMKGNLGAQLRLNAEGQALTGNGTVSLTDFVYGKERVGDLRADLGLLTNRSGLLTADMALWVDGKKTMTLKGALNDSTRVSPFDLDFTMIHFPLSTANAFMPGVARLGGDLDGSLTVTGDASRPVLNGWLQFDSATVRVDMLGTTMMLSDERIPVDSSLVRLDNFGIKACNDNPLTVDGYVDIHDLAAASMNLRLHADNMMLVNTGRPVRGADIYGKAYMDLDAEIHGDMRLLHVNADAGILSGTNVTYIMPEATSAIENRSEGDMVKFVNFADSAAVAKADTIAAPSSLMLDLAATLNIENGTSITVDLGSSNKVQIRPDGSVHYTMSPLNAGRMTGRINLNGGYAKFSPPAMGEKVFDFREGSYVAFSGNAMNPTLDINAVDRVRANVTSTGQNSRLIYFDILLAVTGTLENMNIVFDLATDDDATVANQLATMSPQQRASSAMNMLVTNMYTSGDTKADANLGSNALYSFLTSQLNSWAANNIHGVDLSFGINSYDNVRSGTSTQTTSYSYQISKSLFNDRFKIVVGGNYSTDANADENLAQNLISDISFEYLLNAAGTKVIRIFRHTGFESILEGEITQTGVGFAYRRKIATYRDLFNFLRPKRRKATTTADTAVTIPVADTEKAALHADTTSSL